jgi:hypothetical protein
MREDLNPNTNQSRPANTSSTNSVTQTRSSTLGQTGASFNPSINLDLIVTWIFAVFIGFALITALILFLRKKFYSLKKSSDWKRTVFLEISVPKENAEQVQKDRGSGAQNADKDMIALGEQLIAVLAEYATTNFMTWFRGGPRFSLEMVCTDQEIKFWIACDEDMISVVERQVVAIYNKANIVRLRKIDFFKEDTVAYAQELSLGRRFELPFKTYKLLEGDPLNVITNTMGTLSKEESAAIQLVLVPLQDFWQKKPREIATRINQGQNPEDFLFPSFDSLELVGKIFGGIGSIIGSFFEKKDDKNPMDRDKKDRRTMDISGKYEQIQLTEQQREIVKKLEEKASKPGFYYSLRLVASAKTEVRAKQIVSSMIPSFQIFDNRPLNWFVKGKTDVKETILNFILRAPNFRKFDPFGTTVDLINTEEATSLWHIPNYLVTTPNIKWLLARKPPIPLEIPGPGGDNVFLGKAMARGQIKDVYMKREDRFRHSYILGGSGSGKSVLMTNTIIQDIKNGHGVAVIDPHGELVDDILLRMPKERAEDVIVFSPAFIDRPLGLNMLEYDPLKPTTKTLVIDVLFSIWDKLYDLKKTGGPMFENYMKNAMRLVMSHPESGSTLMEISKVLVDEDFRSFKLAMCDEDGVVDFWEKEATKAGGEASLENMVPYITSKLAPFITNDFIKPMIGQQKSSINFRVGMDNHKVILVKLEKGLIGENSAYLVGMVIVGNMLLAGMGRNDGLKYNEDGTTTDIPAHERTPFFVYIDEMQNFLFDAIPKALEEIRKYKVGFHLAHQFVKQVIVDGNERIKDSIMANCANKFIYRCGADDAQYLEKEFGPTLTASDLMTPERFTCNAILLVDGQKTTPFNISVPPQDPNTDADFRKQLVEMTKQKYGRPREEIEQEIKDRAKLLF